MGDDSLNSTLSSGFGTGAQAAQLAKYRAQALSRTKTAPAVSFKASPLPLTLRKKKKKEPVVSDSSSGFSSESDTSSEESDVSSFGSEQAKRKPSLRKVKTAIFRPPASAKYTPGKYSSEPPVTRDYPWRKK